MLSRVRNGQEIILKTKTTRKPFCVISHPWLFTIEAKQRILKEHVNVEQKLNFNLWQLADMWVAQA